ncbi:MAG TPA: hypothetical protein VK911_03680 [Vicinamibacterales bacterium]|nr:hypothetical protein [Vicinamibacterales bacterium]
MSITRNVARWGGARAARRMSRSVPFFGGILALGMVGAAIRRKGWLRGSADTALNATPFVGALKLGLETLRGRDLIRDKRGPRRT